MSQPALYNILQKRGYAMENNDIYELSQLLGNQNGLENDFSQIFTTLRETLQKKYIQKLHATASARHNDVIEHPSREVTLLRAMKAFTNDNGKQQMDNMIQALLFLQSIQNVGQDVSSLLANKEQTLQAMGADQATAPIQFDSTTRMTGLLITLALANVI